MRVNFTVNGRAQQAELRDLRVIDANGQRVPEDWEPAVAAKLVRQSMRTSGMSAYDPKADDLGFFFSPAAKTHTQGRLGA